MRKLTRPCTSLTRRKQLRIKVPMPRQGFEKLMQPIAEGEIEGLRRSAGQLEPTTAVKASSSVMHFKYIIRKGSVSNKLWRLEDLDRRPAVSGRGRPPKGPRIEPIPYKRGLGCSRLFLSHAAGARGAQCKVLAMVCGNVIVHFKEPMHSARMPTLTIDFFVLSMDHNGHIIWPTAFDERSKAALRKQARMLLQDMLDDSLYPVHPAFAAAMTQTSSSLLSNLQVQRRAERAASRAAASRAAGQPAS